MKKLDFWRADWFLGVMVTLLVLAAAGSDLVQSLERKAYDLGVKAASRTPSDKIAVIAIDKQSIDNIGRWPWPRDVHAKMTDTLAGARAKVIVNTAFFFEPQIDPGLKYINELLEVYKQGEGASPAAGAGELERFGALLQKAERALNADRKLAESFVKAGNVLLPFVFEQFGEAAGNPDKSLPKYAFDNSLAAGARARHGLQPTFLVDSFFDVYTGNIKAGKYQDKIVLIGPTAAGLGTTQVTPISPSSAPVLNMAHVVSSILSEHYFVTPAWGSWVELLVLLLVALYLIVVLPLLGARMGAVVTTVLLVTLVAAHFVLMTTQLLWIQLMAAVTLLLVGHAALVTKRFIVTERGKEKADVESAESNRMTHPNIVTMYDAGEEHDLAYIAMEFLKGRDLAPHTKPDNLLPIPKVLAIIGRVADALGYAHKNNVVHRDIKPANITYDPENDSVKVTDFGIARITDSSRTKTGPVLGTPSYMSPEQLSSTKVEGASDMFSLGVMLYQMVSGRLPFQGDSMAQLMFKIANEAHADIRQHIPNVPACVAAIVNKALAKQPEQRYQSCDQMAKALQLCLMSVQGRAKPVAAAGT